MTLNSILIEQNDSLILRSRPIYDDRDRLSGLLQGSDHGTWDVHDFLYEQERRGLYPRHPYWSLRIFSMIF